MNSYIEKASTANLYQDIELFLCGQRIASYNHHFVNRNPHYILTLITQGEADFHFQTQSVTLKKGAIYVIFPNSNEHYHTKPDIPWSIKWVIINGPNVEKLLKQLGFSREKPFLELNSIIEIDGVFDELYSIFDNPSLQNRCYCMSHLYKIFALLAKKSSGLEYNPHIKAALEYIAANFSKNISPATVANHIGLNNNYFSKLFTKEVGITPSVCITKYRIEKAKKLLLHSDCSAKEIAFLCGFSEQLYFCRVFKKEMNITPTAYRKMGTSL